jgi:serine-type D-Ala-D-Ala carboxypeptidase/endopeptidase (penicillin-binding protein 4)
MQIKNIYYNFIIVAITSSILIACSNTKKITATKPSQNNIDDWANNLVITDSNLLNAHIGINILDATSNTALYNYNANKYFIPASNTKIFTCYAAFKHLGDSLIAATITENNQQIIIEPTADPTLLHSQFKSQPLLQYLQKTNKQIVLNNNNWLSKKFGNGWAWNDFDADYMAERSAMPIYENIAIFSGTKDKISIYPTLLPNLKNTTINKNNVGTGLLDYVDRDYNANNFTLYYNGKTKRSSYIPFITSLQNSAALLGDTLKKNIDVVENNAAIGKRFTIKSQATDSLLKPMMHSSDNFFAEQTLLMVSYAKTATLDDRGTINGLVKTDLSGMPQAPKWVDGSGLSRYNLFTPESITWLLHKQLAEVSWKRIRTVYPTGGTGTLSSYYKNLQGKIFAKTGTLSNNIALSGYLVCNSGKTIIFSVIVNNHMGNTTAIRKAVESFLNKIYDAY